MDGGDGQAGWLGHMRDMWCGGGAAAPTDLLPASRVPGGVTGPGCGHVRLGEVFVCLGRGFTWSECLALGLSGSGYVYEFTHCFFDLLIHIVAPTQPQDT